MFELRTKTSPAIVDKVKRTTTLPTTQSQMVQTAQMATPYAYAQNGETAALKADQTKDGPQFSPPTVTQNGVAVEQSAVLTEIDSDGNPSASVVPGVSTSSAVVAVTGTSSTSPKDQPKRLHVSNIPFRFRDPDLRAMFGQFGPILDVEIIFNERGSKGFGFVTFASSGDADRAREKLHGSVVEGRKIEVNNATARVQTKKPAATLPSAAALRGAAIQRGRVRTYPAAAPFARHPAPLTAAAAATALHGYTPGVYYDPFLGAATADAYRLQPTAAVAAQAALLKTPFTTAQQAGYAAAAGAYTAAAARAYGAVAAAAQPAVAAAAYPAAVAGYGREYADPYLAHSIGPIAGYGATIYRGSYNRFAPY